MHHQNEVSLCCFDFTVFVMTNDRQCGFRMLFSTTTAVLDVSGIILEEMNKNKFVGAVLIDLKKLLIPSTIKSCLKNCGVMVFKTKLLSGLNHI